MCKGFMKPADLATVSLDGRQLSGKRERTSEILLHLAVYLAHPDMGAVVHCHPPHATAFALAREPVPDGILPEAEIFLGQVPIAPYATPGTQACADAIVPFVADTSAILLANHGALTYGPDLQTAWFRMETLEAYCRVLFLSRQLGRLTRLSAEEIQQLADVKARWAQRMAGSRAAGRTKRLD
jgi:L-fuculose-phosphate aldolase